MDTIRSFLGTGWQFPPEFDPASGGVMLVSNEEDIRESLNVLLSTSLGERVMQPRYGCNLEDYLFEPLNSTTVGFLKNLVSNAILFYEPRIVAEEITVTGDDAVALIEGRFSITVTYTIPGTNSRFNFVYDYYKNESLNNG
ncbi:MAG TPA: GPW/gp25 family protein [Puia sp.]